MNLGTKVASAVAATAVCVAACIGVLVHRIAAADALTTARANLDRQLVSAAYDYAAGRESPARIDPADLPGPVAEAVRRGDRVTYLRTGGPKPVLWAATRVSDRNVLALSRSYAPEARAQAELDQALMATGAAATVVATLVGLMLGMRMGRRATSAARTAENIALGRLDARVAPDGRDEIARLAVSVNTMADALRARLEAERRVTADIAHELRTPVTALATASGLLPPGPASQLMAAGVDRLRGLVEDVLEVARLDAGVATVECEPRQMSAMARRAVSGLDAVEVHVVRDAIVVTDSRRVERILANLAVNALRHGAPPVLVEVVGAEVCVRDAGPGFPAELLAVLHASGPQRFRTGSLSGGTGLGLTIAVGQTRLIAARLDFRNRPQGGAEVILRLPAGEPGSGSPHS
ncbi:HAMP domain-containing histidine kinase [Streptomyces sp. IBSBF 2953]|uniref:ATP-binding protein n=1 Tax=Streptomyces TaxID=1883 RepID=UPI002119DF5F|nr:HAMP domain-containing histidine kinase [Streptomyces hayashii]